MNSPTTLPALVCITCFFLLGFSTWTERWSEDVVLQDGRLVKVEREVDWTAKIIFTDPFFGLPTLPHLSNRCPDKFWLKFEHPDTRETIKWQGEQHFNPVLLDVLDGIPYLVVMGRPTKDNESTYGCPELPFIYLKYESGFFGKWVPVPVEMVPEALKTPNLSPQYPDFGNLDGSIEESMLTKQRGGRPRRNMSTQDVSERIGQFTRSTDRQLNKEIPRTYETWRYAYKNGYRNERKLGDCRPPRSPLPSVILPVATKVSLELLHTTEYTPERVVGSEEWGRLTFDGAREEACKQMFQPADPDDYMMGEQFTHDSTATKRVPYSVNSQRQMGVRQICDDHIWFITHQEERDKIVITKFTVTGDLVYRISFLRPEPVQGSIGYIAIPSLKSEGGYLYFDWQDFRDLNQQWRIKRILKLRVRESASPDITITPSASSDLDVGLSAFDEGSYNLAYQKLLPLSDAGVALAQNTLGRMYLTGHGVPQDNSQALLLFRKAASQGLPNAKNNIGAMYAAGLGVKQDYQQAVAWFREAANQRFPLAMDNLADMYANGLGVGPDRAEENRWRAKARSAGFTTKTDVVRIETVGQKEYTQGLELYYQWKFAEAPPFFKQAAEKGHPEAQLILGTLYQAGQGVQKDHGLGEYWTQEAAKQGHHMKDNRDRVVIYSSKEKIEEIEGTIRSPSLPVCGCSRDIPPQECARRFSCRVP